MIFKSDVIIEQRQLLKEYALCNCIQYGYKNIEVKTDISISIYYEQLLYGESIIKKIEDLSKQAVDSILPSSVTDYNFKKPIIASCIAFYKSEKLDSTIKKYDSSIFKSR